MKYIYILALIIIIIISCLLTVENFAIPTAAMRSLFDRNDDAELQRTYEAPPTDTSEDKIKGMITSATVPNTGVSTGLGSVEMRRQEFENEDEKCRAVQFCENLTKELNCGYCLQDDLEGSHPFHYGNEEGAYLKRDGSKQSLCKSGPNRDMGNVWVPPAVLNGKKQQQLEEEEIFIKNKYPNENDPDRLQALSDIQRRKSEAIDLENTGYSGCVKMRERYVCAQIEECSPMNLKMFDINAKDICGFCADDTKAYVRMDLPDNSETYNETKFQSDPKCNNIEIFGDGVNCAAYNNDRDGCLSKKSLQDSTVNACAYNYNNKKVVVPITIPKPSKIKYQNNDKCDSEWGLIRPSQCDWFESQYPCLSSKSGGPHSEKCLNSLWSQMGFTTSYRELISNGEADLVNSWESMDIDRVQESMQSIYEKIYSQDYEVAKKWVKICFGMDVNICNRAGFINDEHPNQYWSYTSDPCMSKLYKYGGGKEGGLANPNNTPKMGYGFFGSLKEGFEERDQFFGALMTNNLRENETEQEKIGSGYGIAGLGSLKLAKGLSQRDYVNLIDSLSKTKDMSNSDAKQVYSKNSSWYNVGSDKGYTSFSNKKWVDKYLSSKLITGESPDYPVDGDKLCWPEFARRMLIHPNVKLLNLKTLSFKDATEFHPISNTIINDNYYNQNMRKMGLTIFENGNNYNVRQDTYDMETFPFWEFLKLSKLYWRNRWSIFKNILLDYEDVEETTYQNIVRPNNENEAKEIAEAYGYRVGGLQPFAGNWATKGLYLVRAGRENGVCYFGRGGSTSNTRTNLSYPHTRVDWNNNQEVLRFLPRSRFYNALPATKNIRETWNKANFFEYKNKDNQMVRVLFKNAYSSENFPYYNFLRHTIKN